MTRTSTTTGRTRRGSRRAGLLTASALAVGLSIAAGAGSASAAVTFPSGAWVVTVATSDCTDHTVDVHPNPSAGAQTTTSTAQVYDYARAAGGERLAARRQPEHSPLRPHVALLRQGLHDVRPRRVRGAGCTATSGCPSPATCSRRAVREHATSGDGRPAGRCGPSARGRQRAGQRAGLGHDVAHRRGQQRRRPGRAPPPARLRRRAARADDGRHRLGPATGRGPARRASGRAPSRRRRPPRGRRQPPAPGPTPCPRPHRRRRATRRGPPPAHGVARDHQGVA